MILVSSMDAAGSLAVAALFRRRSGRAQLARKQFCSTRFRACVVGEVCAA